MRIFACSLAFFLLGGAKELKIVPPDPDTILTDPNHRYDFVTLAGQADSVVRVKESYRLLDDYTQVMVVHLEVAEQITGEPVEPLEMSASIWDVVAPPKLRREGATFLLMVGNRSEVLNVHSNGIPRIFGAGIIPIVDDAVPDDYAHLYDGLLILRPVTLGLIRQQLSLGHLGK